MEARVENVEINVNDHHAEFDKPQENILYDFSSWQSIGSGQESDVEDNINPDLLIEPSVKGYDPSIDEHLPETVSVLTTRAGSKLYLVGTAHFSLASQNDVAKVIQAVQPHRVIVELCEARLRALLCDEETIMNESKNLNFQKVCELIQKSDLYTGLMHVLMLNVNAYLVKEFGMAPGGEFRRAFIEARKVPNCIVGFGDRPFYITLRRTLGMLSWWQKLKMGISLLTPPKVTEEELENLKRRDFVDQVLAEIGNKYPEITEVFVNERDLFLTHSLQLACKPVPTPNGLMPVRVVGVVGMGHTSGIMKHWGKVKKSQIPPILSVPPPSKVGKVIKLVVKSALIGTVAYIGYRLVGSPSLPSVQSVKSSVMGLVKSWVSMQTPDEYDHQCAGVFYVTENVPGPGTDPEDFELEFSAGCQCEDRCDGATCSCTRGVVNYSNGRLTNTTVPIVECNPTVCNCAPTCGNRLVQTGPLNCLFVSETSSRGLGLFTNTRIEKGSFVCEYAGEIIGVEVAKTRIELNRKCHSNNYVMIYVEYVGQESRITTCVDPAVFGNIGRYSNHSCCPNTQIFAVRVNRSTPRLCLFASRDIQANEEITFHYAQGLTDVHCLSDTPCLCGSLNCQEYLPHQPI